MAAPYNFTGNPGGVFLVQATTPLGPDLAVAATSAVDGGGSTGVATVPITGPSGAPGTKYILTAKMFAPAGGNDSWIGLADPTVNGGQSFNNAGAYIGMSSGNWRIDGRGIRGGDDAAILHIGAGGQLTDVAVDVKIELDIDTNTALFSVTDGVTTLSHSFVGGNTFSALSRLAIQQFTTGIAIDDVLVQEIPEPSSILLLGFGGLAGLVTWRRRRN